MASLPTLQPGAPREPRETLVNVEGHRWAIEDSFETAKNEFGLDHNETRSWHGWHRHVSLVMLALAMMAAVRHHANQRPPPKKQRAEPVWSRSDPLVGAGDPARGDALGPTAHPAGPRDCMVTLAPRSSGGRTRRSPQTKITTVMLSRCGQAGQRMRAVIPSFDR